MLSALLLMMASAQASEPADAAKKDPVVCKKSDAGRTGSRLDSFKKVCKRQSDWDEMQRQTDRVAQKISERGGSVGEPYQGKGTAPQ